MKRPTFYAVYVGINAYENCRQLHGCINDVLAMHRYFSRLCAGQDDDAPVDYRPQFLLLPHREEQRELKKEGIAYRKPTRKNIIESFDFFAEADPEAGDYCLFYYSGHGSYVDAPPLFQEVAPDGTLQTLVCSDSRNQNGRDLLDKELGYLIARSLEGKTAASGEAGLHFLAIFDACHSGTVSRGDSELVARMERKGKAVSSNSRILGFTKTGNAFYRPFAEGQKVISKDGLKHGRYVNLSACRDREVAQERILEHQPETGQKARRNHGVFSFSLLRTLERSGTDLSYGELMRRVQMEVRNRVGNQTPVLGKTNLTDDHLFFLKQRLKTPAKSYEIGLRTTRMGQEWYLNAGALNGLLPATAAQPAQLKLTDGSERIIDIVAVNSMECLLDAAAFTPEDATKNLRAVVHQMPFAQTVIDYDEQLSRADRQAFEVLFAQKQFRYIRQAAEGEKASYRIKPAQKSGQKAFMLAREGSDMPVFLPVTTAANFLQDAEQVGKWENTLLLANQDTRIPRTDIQVSCRQLEGVSLNSSMLQQMQDYQQALRFRTTQFSPPVINPDRIQLNYRKVGQDYAAPMLSVSIANQSAQQDYWVGTLYLDSAFGITSRNLQVQELKVQTSTPLDLEFRDDARGLRLPFVPVLFDAHYHDYGLTEITDYLIIILAKKPFSLDDFEQTPLPLTDSRGQGLFTPDLHEDDWMTIKIPLTIVYPLEQVQLKPGEQQVIASTARKNQQQAALRIEAPAGFGARVNATTAARAKRVVDSLAESRTTVNQRALLPSGALWQGAEGKTGVFCNGLDVAPDQQLSILELTDIVGKIDPDRPLKIHPGTALAPEESILPYGYDEATDIYFPLGYTDGDGVVRIEQLPPPSAVRLGSDAEDTPGDANEKSIGRSIKLFFQKLVWSKLTGYHEYQTLALVKTGQINEARLAYHGTDAATDREVLAQMKQYLSAQITATGKSGVLLLVHGIIGNTDEQVAAVFQRTNIHEQYAAVLTFDYENLNTPIEKTAQQLAKCLKQLELADGQLTIIAHSMGGLVARYMIEQEGMQAMVRRLLQAGTPNGGSELSDFRKKITGWLGLAINGVAFIQPYLGILSLLGKGLEKRIFKTLDQMAPDSAFLSRLNAAALPDTLSYALIAGDTNLIKATLLKKDPMWKKLLKALKQRGLYLFLDYLVFDNIPNDMAVQVARMKAIPHPGVRVMVIDCNHMMYFSNPDSLQLLQELLD